MAYLKEQSSMEKMIYKLKENYLLFKRKSLNILKRITNSKLSDTDPYTIQSQKSHDPRFLDYYISDAIMQYSLGNPSYTNVRLLDGYPKNDLYLYLGIVGNADNAIGILQTDIPIEEIIASPSGNDIFTKLLQKEYASSQLENSWKSQDVALNDDTPSIFKPSFSLGYISSKNNFFEIKPDTTPEIQSILDSQKENTNTKNKRVSEKDVLFKIGDLNISNTYIERVVNTNSGLGTTFKGINIDSIPYVYSNVRLLEKTNDSYIYSGKIATGNTTKSEKISENIISIDSSKKIYRNVLIALPKPIDTIVTEHQYKIDDVFARAFLDDYLAEHTITDENISYTYVGKVKQYSENDIYNLDSYNVLSVEILNSIKRKLTFKRKFRDIDFTQKIDPLDPPSER